MIYFDNAATSFPKPPETKEAILAALESLGNPGRGAHAAALAADRTLYRVREELAELFHAEDPSRIAFTQNTTQALNTAICGLLNPGDHVITTMAEHNSVLRPLYRLEEQGVELTIVPVDAAGRIDMAAMEKAVRKNTRAIVITHASNVTGNVTDLRAVSRIAQAHGLLLIVDAAQTAGILPIDVQSQHIDILCFPGHKGLYGPQGTGGIYVRKGVTLRPLLVGGSGVHSFAREQPKEMPTALEAGTQNAHGIAGLGGGLSFLTRVSVETICAREETLARRFYLGVRDIPGVTLYGDFGAWDERGASGYCERVATVSLNIGDLDASETAELLSENFDIAVRAGAHCAPLMHEALGTGARGTARFSFSTFNTEEEIDAGIRAVREIAEAAAE